MLKNPLLFIYKTLYIREMKIRSKIVIFFFTLNLLSCKSSAQETETKKPTTEFDLSTVDEFRDTKLKGQIINDYDSIFNPNQRRELADLIYDYNIKTTRQIVVVTIDSIKPYSNIQNFATDLGKYWGVGTYEKDNGLVILFCKPERKIGIATGYGTELVLTDEICKSVIDSVILPEFRNGKYYNGIKNGVTELMKMWK